jgi:hypothetical protein
MSVLASPASWAKSYDGFIARNAGQVAQIESALRSLTYIIPGTTNVQQSDLILIFAVIIYR